MVWNTLFDPIFNPLLVLDPVWVLFIISLCISLLITLAYKLFTDQKLMKELKDEMKHLQKQMKELRDHPQKMMEMQKHAMTKNMEYMKHSMKPTLFTMLPILLIFGWMHAHLAYEPIMPGEQFSITAEFEKGITGEITLVQDNLDIAQKTVPITDGTAEWRLSGGAGEYVLQYDYQGKSYFQDLTITDSRGYSPVELKVGENGLNTITINNEPMHPLGNFSLFGWRPGWLATYILFSLVLSITVRKLLKVH